MAWSGRESNPPGRTSRRLTRAPALRPTLREQDAHWCRDNDAGTQHDSTMAAKRNKATAGRETAPSDAAFTRVVRKMLSSPPKPHDQMKKGAAPKRDPRSSGKGSKP